MSYELTIEGDAAARMLKSGNFSLPVYAASLSISGTLGPPDIDAAL
jgi:hypothetical protein